MVFLIVLYNLNISQSSTVLSLLDCVNSVELTGFHDVTIHIWDNSPNSQNKCDIEKVRSSFEGKANFVYYHCKNNHPLSKVYNKVIDQYLDSASYLTLLDQDSTFTYHYFEQLLPVCASKIYDLVLPKIRHKNVIVSPSLCFWVLGRYISDLNSGAICFKHLSAINSGMSISIDFLKRYPFHYNSSLKNYCTDDCFMQFFREKKGSAYVLNYIFEHDLSLSTLNSNSDVLRSRYKELLAAWRVLHGNILIQKIPLELYIVAHKIKMTIKYKDVRYFWC